MAKMPKRSSAKEIVEKRIRRYFVRTVLPSVLNVKANDARGSTIEVGHHVFAKAPRKELTNATIRRGKHSVTSRDLLPGENIILHVHTDTPELSFIDIRSAIDTVVESGKVTAVVDVIDSSRAVRHIQRGLVEPHYLLMVGEMRRPRKRDQQLAKKVVNEAAGMLEVSGRAHYFPTQELMGMAPEKLESLRGYLEKKDREADKYPDGDLEIGRIYGQARKHIRKYYGRLFRTKYVAMPGYRYDRGAKTFVPVDPLKKVLRWNYMQR